MKFIFPQNYNFKNKLFGIIDYTNLFLNIIWNFFIYFIIKFLFNNITIKIFVFIVFSLPFLLFSIFGVKQENILSIFLYIVKYYRNHRLYLYSKK